MTPLEEIAKKQRQTTSHFETREELEAWVWHLWQNTPANQADIARQCRVSTTTIANILKKGKP